MLAHLLVLWHPAHHSSSLSCCGRPSCLRPPSRAVSVLSCVHFFLRPAASPEELVAAARWWLGGLARLGLVPALWIALPEMARHWLPAQLGNPALDIANNFNYIFIFLFGYAITAADEHGLKEVVARGRWLYLVLGIIFSGVKSTSWIVEDDLTTGKAPFGVCMGLARALGEWLLVLGVYGVARHTFTRPYRLLPLLSQVAMPFYLTHQQVLVAILSGAMWIPVLGSFPVVLLLATLATALLSFTITKLGPVRYLFGLPPPKGSGIPGKFCSGLLPLSLLAVAVTVLIIGTVLAKNYLTT